MSEAKPFRISKKEVWEAYQRVKENKGAAGCPSQSIEDFEKKLKKNLYKIWNRMSSGSYFPPPVRTVQIPKKNGGERKLGIPTVADRIAQQVVKARLEPVLDPLFHADSYGYRPGKSALGAVGQARERCWRRDWVIDLDIKAFFDNLDHNLLLRAVKKHASEQWIVLYIERWLQAPVQEENGRLIPREKGTPQGGVASPLLANLFLHYALDRWLTVNYPRVPFERYADDGIVHCRTERQARFVLDVIRARFAECGLELHATKTKIVYCKDDDRRGMYENITFDFLGYSFQPRRAKNRWGKFFVNFLPAISAKAAKKIRQTIRDWRMASTRNNQRLEDLASFTNPVVRGWLNYYGRFYRSKCIQVLRHFNEALGQWARRKFKRFKRRERASMHWLGRIARRDPNLFVLWEHGVRPEAGE